MSDIHQFVADVGNAVSAIRRGEHLDDTFVEHGKFSATIMRSSAPFGAVVSELSVPKITIAEATKIIHAVEDAVFHNDAPCMLFFRFPCAAMFRVLNMHRYCVLPYQPKHNVLVKGSANLIGDKSKRGTPQDHPGIYADAET